MAFRDMIPGFTLCRYFCFQEVDCLLRNGAQGQKPVIRVLDPVLKCDVMIVNEISPVRIDSPPLWIHRNDQPCWAVPSAIFKWPMHGYHPANVALAAGLFPDDEGQIALAATQFGVANNIGHAILLFSGIAEMAGAASWTKSPRPARWANPEHFSSLVSIAGQIASSNCLIFGSG
jgi:hypothetical protein